MESELTMVVNRLNIGLGNRAIKNHQIVHAGYRAGKRADCGSWDWKRSRR